MTCVSGTGDGFEWLKQGGRDARVLCTPDAIAKEVVQW
jgi:hypothetical protein